MRAKGIFLINKPIGITSHDVVDRLRKITSEERIGHAGTLDPLASGLLIIAISREFTKKLDDFRGLDKEYLAKIKLGEISDTYDAEGKLTCISNVQPKLNRIKAVLQSFVGKYNQMPPAFSAKKIRGQKAYSLARAGKKVELKPKEVTISKLELLEYKYPEIRFRTTVSSGTYIRSLAHDIGQQLKVGAYLTKLVRTKIGDYNLSQAISLDSINSEEDLSPLELYAH